MYEPLVEPRTLAFGQDAGNEVETFSLDVADLRHHPEFVKPCLWHTVLHDLAVRADEIRNPGVLADQGRTGRYVPEKVLNALPDSGGLDVAGDDQHRVRGTVVLVEPVIDVFEAGGFQVFHVADDRP